MDKVERLIEQARRLPPRDRQKLIVALMKWHKDGKRTAKPTKKQKPRKVVRERPYAALLELAGTAHSDYTDVSTDKYKHLAEIYYDRHEGE